MFDNFLICWFFFLGFQDFFFVFFWIFLDFLGVFRFLWLFWIWGFFEFFWIFKIFFGFFLVFWGFLSKLLRSLLNVIKVTTEHKKLPKMGQNSIISSFFDRRAKKAWAKGQSPPQERKVGPCSGPYLLVLLTSQCKLHLVVKIMLF